MNKVRQINRDILLQIENKKQFEAVSFGIFVKNNVTKCSIIRNFSYKKLAESVGRSVSYVKGKVEILKSMGLVEFYSKNGVQFIKFCRLAHCKVRSSRNGKIKYNPKKLNVTLEYKTRFMDIKELTLYLQSFAIKESINQRSFVNGHYTDMTSSHSTLARKSKRSVDSFIHNRDVDYGFSYKLLVNKFHCSNSTIVKIRKFGSQHKMFRVYGVKLITDCKHQDCSGNFGDYYHYHKNGKLVKVLPNQYLPYTIPNSFKKQLRNLPSNIKEGSIDCYNEGTIEEYTKRHLMKSFVNSLGLVSSLSTNTSSVNISSEYSCLSKIKIKNI